MADTYGRRGFLRVGATTVAGLGVSGAASATETDGERNDGEDIDEQRSDELDFEQVPLGTLDGVESLIETVPAAEIAERATGIRPGSQLIISRDGTTASCTANFVWRDGDGSCYVGAAGHCFLPLEANASESAATEGEIGFDVSENDVSIAVDGTFGGELASSLEQIEVVELGEVVYARQTEPGGQSGVGYDFGIVRIPSRAEDLVDPSLPQFGGPTGVSENAASPGTPVHLYGAGVGNGELFLTQGRTGVSLGDTGSPESWQAAIRATPGDSGGPLVTSSVGSLPPEGDAAAGILTHLSTNGIGGTTIGQCKALAAEEADLELAVVQPEGA